MFGRDKRLNGRNERWDVCLHNVPNQSHINTSIFAYQAVTHSYHFALWYFRVRFLCFRRYFTSSFTNNLKLPQRCTLYQIVRLEYTPGYAGRKDQNLAGGYEHIKKVSTILPHKLS